MDPRTELYEFLYVGTRFVIYYYGLFYMIPNGLVSRKELSVKFYDNYFFILDLLIKVRHKIKVNKTDFPPLPPLPNHAPSSARDGSPIYMLEWR